MACSPRPCWRLPSCGSTHHWYSHGLDDQTNQCVQLAEELRSALEAFGTGHSSLGLLQTVPGDILKVDKSFVDTITMAGRHAVIAGALIQVSDCLGLSAVAEGVETAEQAAKLYELGYRLAQGYHFGRPTAEPDFTPMRPPVSTGSGPVGVGLAEPG